MEQTGLRIVFVCDGHRRVLGTLTDGDVRRAILAGAAVTSQHVSTIMNRGFASVVPSSGRVEVLDLMRARGIEQIPVIDDRGRLCGIHSIHELIRSPVSDSWAVILAGGKGTRLRPLTEHVPKPMVPVAGRPILERLVLHLATHGVRRIFLSVNHLAGVIEDHFGDGSRFGCSIEYLREETALGTCGPLSLLPPKRKFPLIVLNGDLVTQVNIDRLLQFHSHGGYVATLGLRPYHVDIPFGVAEVRGNRLVTLREKPTERMLISAGIYVVGPRALRLVPRHQKFQMPELFDRCLGKKLKVGAYVVEGDWSDVGDPSDLRRAKGES